MEEEVVSSSEMPFGIPLGTTRDHSFWKKKKNGFDCFAFSCGKQGASEPSFLAFSSFFILMYVQYFQEKNFSDSTRVCNHCIKKKHTLNCVLCCDFVTSGDAGGTKPHQCHTRSHSKRHAF